MFLWPSQACSARVSWVNRHLAVPHRALGRKSLLALLYPLQDRFYTEREQSSFDGTSDECPGGLSVAPEQALGPLGKRLRRYVPRRIVRRRHLCASVKCRMDARH